MNQISFNELEEWHEKAKKFTLVDVREPEEHEGFNIGGLLRPLSAIHTWKADMKKVPLPIVFYCKRGIRSQIAIQRLSATIDRENMYNLTGGIIKKATQ